MAARRPTPGTPLYYCCVGAGRTHNPYETPAAHPGVGEPQTPPDSTPAPTPAQTGDLSDGARMIGSWNENAYSKTALLGNATIALDSGPAQPGPDRGHCVRQAGR